jgi:hypothetical protein
LLFKRVSVKGIIKNKTVLNLIRILVAAICQRAGLYVFVKELIVPLIYICCVLDFQTRFRQHLANSFRPDRGGDDKLYCNGG